MKAVHGIIVLSMKNRWIILSMVFLTPICVVLGRPSCRIAWAAESSSNASLFGIPEPLMTSKEILDLAFAKKCWRQKLLAPKS